jgi:signal transduction histidine kinase
MKLFRRFFGGMRGRIMIFILLVSSLTGILVGISSYYIARSSIKDQAYGNLSNITHGVQTIISDVWLPTLEGQMRILAGVAERLYGMYEGVEGIAMGLAETEGRIPGFRRLSVFLPNGFLLTSSDPGYNVGRVREMAGLEEAETLVIPFRLMGGPARQEMVMTVAVPIMIEGEVAGVLAGDLTPEGISKEMGSLRVGSSGEAYLVNGEGRLITLPPKAAERGGLEIAGGPLDTEGVRRVTAGESGIAEYVNYDGEKVVGSFAWMPEAGWGLIVEESAGMAFSRLGDLRTSVILIVLALAVIALIASAFLSRRVSEPLAVLTTGAERLALGDLDYRIDLKGAEEVEKLAGSFNRMAVAIQGSHEIMEQRVRESTREMRALNETITLLRRISRPDEILQRALQLFMEFTACEMGWCYLAGDGAWKLLYQRCPGEYAASMPETIKPGEGMLGRIMESGEAMFRGSVDECEEDEVSRMVRGGSFTALPLRSPSRVLGLVGMASARRHRFSGESKATLRAMAGEVGIALENALLYLELQGHIAELEKANRELRGLDEMKSNFISAVTHELKQPLALISGYAQTIYDYYDNLTYEEEMHCLRVTIERTRFLSSLVEDLLDISMLEVGRLRMRSEELDLAALAHRAAEEYIPGGEEQPVTILFPPEFPFVVADAKRIEQVFSNLLSNAVKFSDGRGEIRISGEIARGHARVRVEDLGTGIGAAHLDKIFDRFYQADATSRRPYPGVGLGLFICRQIIEAHGGRIWAENRPEGGSAFIFELPLDPGRGSEDGR